MGPFNRRLGKFEILEKLGRGGMADVYLARDDNSREQVALKLIEHGPDADTRDSIEAERRGAALQARLAAIDSHVVPIYETDDTDGYFFVSMEYVEGEDLANVIRRGPLEPRRAAEIALAIAETLEHAHTLGVTIAGKEHSGVVHGDIKPRNIRIDSSGRVRLLDFGIAKALSLSRRLTRNEFGSVPYASPERLDTGEVDAGCDLWSLGVVLYEMLAGAQPFQAESTERLERKIRSRMAPAELPDAVPEPLRRIVAKLLAADAGRRYSSAGELAADLTAFLEGREIAIEEEDPDATRRTTRREDEPEGDATRRTTRPVPSVVKSKTTRRVLVYLLVGLLIYMLYAAAADYLLWKRGRALARQIESEELTDLDQIWKKWSELSKGRTSSLILYSPRGAVRQRLVAAADRVIDDYRGDNRVSENDWKRALGYLSKALLLAPGEKSIRGKMRLSEGHLARINRNLHEGVAKFNEAQQLMPRSPDPQLGLARAYSALRDIDKAYDALRQAERHGYRLGAREKALLADGYRDRGHRLWWDSRNIRGLPQEKDQIQRAADDYRRALEIYQEIVPYGGASTSIVTVQNALTEVETRLYTLDHPADTSLLQPEAKPQ